MLSAFGVQLQQQGHKQLAGHAPCEQMTGWSTSGRAAPSSVPPGSCALPHGTSAHLGARPGLPSAPQRRAAGPLTHLRPTAPAAMRTHPAPPPSLQGQTGLSLPHCAQVCWQYHRDQEHAQGMVTRYAVHDANHVAHPDEHLRASPDNMCGSSGGSPAAAEHQCWWPAIHCCACQ